MVGLNISQLLLPEDKDVFAIATKEMLADDSKTVEVVFHVIASGDIKVPFEMEGKGMLMYNRVTGEPSHSMWVIKSLGSRRWSILSSDVLHLDDVDENDSNLNGSVLPISPAIKNIHALAMRRAISHGGFPVSRALDSPNQLLTIPPALCNICERWIVAAFFEQHSELCVEIHRAEMDVSTCNDSLTELKQYVQGLCDLSTAEVQELVSNPSKFIQESVDQDNDEAVSVHSRDSIFGESLPLEDNKTTLLELKRAEMESYLSLLEIMNVALSIETPGVNDDENMSHSPRLRPSSQDKSKFITILYWRPPSTDDPDIESLILDIEMITKSKVDAVNRMQNCLEYNERTRSNFQHTVMHSNDWTEFVPQKTQNETSTTRTEKPAPKQKQPAPVLTDVTEEQQKGHQNIKKSIFKKIKDWKSKGKRGNSNKQSKRASKRKNNSSLPPPVTMTPKSTPATKIVEMETIDTPLNSPKFHSTTILPPPRKSSLPNQQQISGSSTPSLGKSPLSPLPAPISSARPVAPSIKDFDIIKPISKGAFGSVFLAKKRVTGDYYAIKFLKKSDMIAKNQVTNVKAERMILMTQTDSPYVTKLYYTFQSKDYLYLVLEYLNGGDCSSLIKVLGNLPCDWARNYLAEVTLGLSYLHGKQIIHRYSIFYSVLGYLVLLTKFPFFFVETSNLTIC